ncbi:aminotransferase family protein [Cytobacillus purgationiresistens]|uniref:Putrescine aminotransferase n=1 Tax=Cytobacillus purgationiresistens TaxID=863449 RepID=A0ABU0APP1_9BACI|nr:aspartate aminotransferase family protein [Cytobacillus purgationiresistens]MDQ0273254.1 putrescine aminotransferase [Cytobacillus purgationiresistens]
MALYSEKQISQLFELDKKHYLHPTTPIKQHQVNGPKFIFTEGKGVYLTDVYGDKYLDALASLWNVNIGHGRKEIAEAAYQQMSKLAYSSSFSNLSHDMVIKLSEKLSTLTPGDLNVFFYTSGGSESNDTAFKLVRHYWKLKGEPQKRKIIALDRAYHGITVGATSATGIPQFHDMAASLAPDFLHAAAHQTNCEQGDTTDPNYERSIRGLIESEGAETVAAVILEPIQGAGGIIISPDGYLEAVRRLCDEYGILLIADEVICGFGRTGKMFGVDNWEVVPDIMTLAKGITSGYIQLGAVAISERLRDELAIVSNDMLFHGFTYSGHPTACAVALKNIEIIENEKIVQHAKDMEAELFKGMCYLETKHDIVTKSRAKGLLGAFELYADKENRLPFEPAAMAAQKLVEECFKRKLIIRSITYNGTNIIAMSPPLIITKEEIETIISILSESISAVEKQLHNKIL